MRLWSLHPRYLDQQGLCGLWREAIMARNALEQGGEHGYYNHPQLDRFKTAADRFPGTKPIYPYLHQVYLESKRRDYDFDQSVFDGVEGKLLINKKMIPVPNGQVNFEIEHLKSKLKKRAGDAYIDFLSAFGHIPDLHPLFYMVNGDKADWERGEL